MDCRHSFKKSILNTLYLLILFLFSAQCMAFLIPVAGPQLEPKKGRFLVATDNLAQTSFKETVILITHYSSALGATGITINRSANLPLNEAFPAVKELKDISQPLYLGGPVKTDGIFVLMKTKRPHTGMKQVINDIYFTVGLDAVIHGLPKAIDGEATRAYAGYAGWAPGQLQAEIKRGDWIIVDTDTSIVFEENPETLWQQLRKTWSGEWI
ncbi:MAG: YqgE/AlgH family protein [Gammaproteobacteria bacterium]|nr:YqgE/AlgH family protein [Gammaproteobacteria bacterium]